MTSDVMSLDIKEEPLDIKEEPLDIKEEPLEIKEEPLVIKEEPLDIKEEPLDIDEEALVAEEQWLQRVKEEEGGLAPSFTEVKLEASDSLVQAGGCRFVQGDLDEEISTIAVPLHYNLKDEPRRGECDKTPSCSEVKLEACDSHSEVFTSTNEDSTFNKTENGYTVRNEVSTVELQSSQNISTQTSRGKHHACEVCGKRFEACSSLKLHLLTHDADQPSTSITCNVPPSQKDQLIGNSLTPTKELPYSDGEFVSEGCGESLSEGKAMKTHMKKDVEKSLSCTHCNRRFSCSSHLKRHLLTHTGERPHVCEVCTKSFNQLGHLKEHIQTHTGERPYSCEVCKKSFLRSGKLKQHIRTHTGERPYSCEVCKKSYIQLGHLNVHMQTHTGERSYVCEVCKKSFFRSDKLKQHSLTHTGEQPYICEICKKSFSRSACLKRHIRTHTVEQPNVCDLCKKSFSCKGNLKQHYRTHTGERPYSCEVCKKSFSTSGNFKKHMCSGELLLGI